MVNEIRLENFAYLMQFSTWENTLLIGNLYEWLEEFISMSLNHEAIHEVLSQIEGDLTSIAFDNIFGLVDLSILLCPEEYSEFDLICRRRAERIWEREEYHSKLQNETLRKAKEIFRE